MTRFARTATIAAVALALASPAARAQAPAQEKGKPAPEEKTGVKVGEKAPDFRLKDGEGKERSLDEFLGKGKVALVFTRSADW